MAKIDPFTMRRVTKFVEDFRQRSGQLPTLKDFESAGFESDLIDALVKKSVLERFYVTLSNGAVVKGFKVKH